MSIIKEYNIKVEKNESGEATISGTLSPEIIEKHRSEAMQFFSNNLKIDGFRQGNIPENIIKKNVSETAILEETASLALNSIYPDIVREAKLDVFGRPHVHFTKLAPGNPVEFTIHTALAPVVEVADYKKIAKELNSKREEVTITDEEVDKALLEIRKQLDLRDKSAEAESEDTATGVEDDSEDKAEKEPSPLTDEKVQGISQDKTVEEFTKTVREDLLAHKKNQAEEKHRLELIEKVLAESKISVPAMVVESELQSMMAQFAHDVMQAGIKMEDYLAQAGKTEEELIKEWRPHAENRAKMQLLLNKIALDEELFPAREVVTAEADKIMTENPKADRERVEIYVETQLANGNVFTFLAKEK